jgi:hypothetical protein
MRWERVTADDGSGEWLLQEGDSAVRMLVLDGINPPPYTDEAEGHGAWRLLAWPVAEGRFPIVGVDAPEVFRVDTAYVLTQLGGDHGDWVRARLTILLLRMQRSLAGEGAALPDDRLAAHVNAVHADLVEELETAWPADDWRMPVPAWMADELPDGHDELLALMPASRPPSFVRPAAALAADTERASLRGLVAQILREVRRRISTSSAAPTAPADHTEAAAADATCAPSPSEA